MSRFRTQLAVNKCSILCSILCFGPISTSVDLQIDGNILPIVSTVKDLGITFDKNLSSTSHVISVVFTANQRVNLLLRSFLTRNRTVLVKAYITYVKPILEYGSVVWSPYETGDISCIEKVQRSFTKRLPGLKNFTYRNQLAIINLETLECRRLRADLCYRIVFSLNKMLILVHFSFCAFQLWHSTWSSLQIVR